MWAVGGVGLGVEVVGFGVGEGEEKEGGEVGARRVEEAGFARAMAQKGQQGLELWVLVDGGGIGEWVALEGSWASGYGKSCTLHSTLQR